MNQVSSNPILQRIELTAWNIVIAGMTRSRLLRSAIRSGAQIGRDMDWKKDPKIMGMLAVGGLLFGSSLSIVFLLIS